MDGFVIESDVLKSYEGAEEIVIIPEGITQIWENAFRGNEVLKRVYIPKAVKWVGQNAFGGCVNLTVYCEAEPSDGWIDKTETVVEECYTAEDDAFNFHRSSGGWTSHRVERQVVRKWNPLDRPVISFADKRDFIKDE